MQTQSYYRRITQYYGAESGADGADEKNAERINSIEGSDFADQSTPIAVNCAGYVILDYPFKTTGRRHDFYLQIMDSGRLECGFPGDTYMMSAGDFIIHSPETPYAYEQLAKYCGGAYYWLHFTGGSALELIRRNGFETDRRYSLTAMDDELRGIFIKLFRELMLCERGFEDICAALLINIIVELGRKSVGADRLKQNRFAALAEYLHCHYTEKLSIAELAAGEHLSQSRFRELFHSSFGCAPGDYITGLRMRRARELLESTELPVSVIAEMCGYTDEMYFMRIFKKKNGVSALKYRKSLR